MKEMLTNGCSDVCGLQFWFYTKTMFKRCTYTVNENITSQYITMTLLCLQVNQPCGQPTSPKSSLQTIALMVFVSICVM